jgi:hypothetical protein
MSYCSYAIMHCTAIRHHHSIKCYKFFGQPTSFSQAEYTCNVLQGRSTVDR